MEIKLRFDQKLSEWSRLKAGVLGILKEEKKALFKCLIERPGHYQVMFKVEGTSRMCGGRMEAPGRWDVSILTDQEVYIFPSLHTPTSSNLHSPPPRQENPL